MSHLDRLINKAKDSLWDPEHVERVRDQTHSIRRETYDKIQWDYARDQVPILGRQVDDLAGDFETSPPAYEDLFNLLLQGDPRPTDDDQLIEKYLPQAHMMRAMGDSVEFEVLRKETKYDDFTSALVMLTMRDKMRKAFEELQRAQDRQQAAQDALAQALQSAMDAAASGEGTDEATQGLADALEGVEQAGGDAEASAEIAAGLMRGAGQKANEDLQEQKETASAYGLAPGVVKRMPFEERRALVEKLNNPKLREVADLVGRFRRSADTERRRAVVHSVDETVDYQLGNDLNRLAESELTNLAIPELEDLFWLRYVNHELVIRETKTVDHADRGPIVLVCDESGSMDEDLGGHSREAWSKAVSLAMRDHAARQKRDFIYIGYGGRGQVREKHFPKGRGTIEDTVDFVTHFYKGGTEYQAPLTRAMGIVADYHGRGQGRPDIVFITDGAFVVPEQFKTDWKQGRDEFGVTCYGIQVGGSATSDMRKVVDRCMQIDKLTAGPSGVKDLFRTI